MSTPEPELLKILGMKLCVLQVDGRNWILFVCLEFCWVVLKLRRVYYKFSLNNLKELHLVFDLQSIMSSF